MGLRAHVPHMAIRVNKAVKHLAHEILISLTLKAQRSRETHPHSPTGHKTAMPGLRANTQAASLPSSIVIFQHGLPAPVA